MPLKLIAAIAVAACWAFPASAGEGHDAGYEWAQEQGITDPDDCGGNSQSFIEGCEEAAEEAADEEDEEY